MEEKKFTFGGDIKKSLSNGYQLDILKLFKSAVKVTRDNYLALIIASIFALVVFASCYQVLIKLLVGHNENTLMLIMLLCKSLIVPPLLTGLYMMGVHHAIGIKTRYSHLFNYFHLWLKLSLASLIVSLITNAMSLLFVQITPELGLALSLFLLIYLHMAFCLSYPLIVEKRLSPILALQLSFRLVHKNFIQFGALYILLLILLFVALLPSGLGLFLFIPFYFNVMGIVYRHICGVSVIAHAGQKKGEFEA